MADRLLLVDFFCMCFGVGSWVAINGVWVELPLLVAKLPESWSLASYMSIIVQLANLGPLLYSLLHMLKPSLAFPPIIYTLLGIGTTSSLLLTQFWDATSEIGGKTHSTGLLVLMFALSLVDCTSSVLYIPYMASWKSIYISSYLVGEGLSGLLPAIVSLAQGVGGNTKCNNVTLENGTWHLEPAELHPNFSVDAFFWFIFAMMMLSSVGFMCLEWLPVLQWERASFVTISRRRCDTDNVVSGQSTSGLVQQGQTVAVGKSSFIILLILQCWASLLANGALLSIQSYSCGSYGNIPFHLAVCLAALANPLAAFTTMILPRASTKTVGLLAFLGSLAAAYIVTLAVMSPDPPLVEYTAGAALMVISWILFMGIITYVRVEIANILRQNGAQALFWSGLVTQVGSAIGSIVMFVLVNHTNIFVAYNPCAT